MLILSLIRPTQDQGCVGGFKACHIRLFVQLCDIIKMILMLRIEASL